MALPEKAVLRIVQTTSLAPGGETAVIYEAGTEFEPDPHLAVVKRRKRVADFPLAGLFSEVAIGSSYSIVKASQVRADERTFFLAAFRNIGDGSRTAFAGVTGTKDGYKVDLREWTSEGRIRILRSGNIQVWSADDDGQCNWCPQHYDVSTLQWKNGHLTVVSKFKTNNAFNPEPIANNPIVVEK